eukprot:GFKZ01001066.1.p1 GENE.GFKZ01001066.1~~GFKZ01001066.1.p1  ORF type:complete len:304 (+),score=28.48 GFKZ01001066.1:811-1722(+)
MDGLLRSEFALVLRDSLNSTPRRHVVAHPSPTLPSLPSPQKKPRVSGADFGIHCDMQLEPRVQFAPIPTSPTSPLPPSKILESPAMPSTPSKDVKLAHHTRLPPLSRQDPQLADRSPIAKPKRRHSDQPSPNARNLTSSLMAITSPMPRPLDVLATVSAEQSIQSELLSSARNRAPEPLTVANLPTSPVNSEPLTPVVPEEKKKSRRSSKAGSSGRIFACKMCPSTFSQQFNLNKHVRAVHERRRPFECETCHAKFQQKSHRTMHRLAVHEKLRQFACDQCPASFSWRGVLKKHRRSIHGIDE